MNLLVKFLLHHFVVGNLILFDFGYKIVAIESTRDVIGMRKRWRIKTIKFTTKTALVCVIKFHNTSEQFRVFS